MYYIALATIFAGLLIIVRNILIFHSFLQDNLWNLWCFRGKRKKIKGMSINVKAVMAF